MIEPLLVALAVRLALVVVGGVVDEFLGFLDFTDVDYRVFSDASKLMLKGSSPYDRPTYRYPPVLAALLLPNEVIPIFGKLMFCGFDILIVNNMNKIECGKKQNFQSWMWAINPISSVIAARGSCDAIINWVVLQMYSCAIAEKYVQCGLFAGFAVYFRLYPVIYLPAVSYYFLDCDEFSQIFKVQKFSVLKLAKLFVSSIWRSYYFLLTTVCTCFTCVSVSYYLYGEPYLQEAVLYHLSRWDHRHNFSLHFLWIYFSKAVGEWREYQQELRDAGEDVQMRCVSEKSGNCTAGPLRSLLESDNSWYRDYTQDRLTSVALLLPQILLFMGVVLLYGKRSLALCMLLQTMIFVAYNKVITAQYFTWYLCLIPICWQSLRRIPQTVAIAAGCCWLLSVAIWLGCAYRLEFLGLPELLYVWLASCLFHVANVACITVIIWFC